MLFGTERSHPVPPHQYHGEERRIRRGAVQALIQYIADATVSRRTVCTPKPCAHQHGTVLVEDKVDLLRIQALAGERNALPDGCIKGDMNPYDQTLRVFRRISIGPAVRPMWPRWLGTRTSSG